MTEKKQPESKLVSLNDELMSEFRLTELEKRLETDPLVVANPIDGFDESEAEDIVCPNKFIYCSNGFYE